MDLLLATLADFVTLIAQENGAAQELTGFQKFLSNPLILPAGLFFLFYFIFIAPERRKRAEEAKMMKALKKNDRIVTIGGIHGTIVAAPADSDVVTVRIDESGSTRIKLNRSAIARIVSDKETSETKLKESSPPTKDS